MLSPDDLAQILRAYPVLRELGNGLAARLAQEAAPVHIAARQALFDVGSPCHQFLALTAGTVRVVRPVRNGHELLLYRLVPGDSCILTTACLLGQTAYTARGLAETDVAGYRLPQALFTALIEQAAPFRTFVFRMFAARVTQLIELVEEVAFRKLEQRLAAALLTKGTEVTTTHQRLADELGTEREVVSRLLEGFQSQGIVQLRRGQIQVVDGPALARIAHVAFN